MHLAFGALALGGLAMATSTKDFLAIPLLVMALLRLRFTWPCYGRLFRDWLVLGLLLWAGLIAVSLTWSPDPAMGFEHLRAFRYAIVCLALWPVVHRPGPLVAGFVLGATVNVVVQGLQWMEAFGLRPGMDQRLTGLMHPIRTAMALASACLWCLSAAAMLPPGRRGRLAALLGAAISTAAGVAMTGSRGPWIALAAGLAALVVLLAIRRPERRRRLIVAAGAMLLAGLALSPLAADFVSTRTQQARADLAAAGEGDFDTNLGFRLASYGAAIELAGQRPLVGHGAGAFGVEAPELVPELSWEGITHAHSTWLNIAVETGIPSLILVLGLFGAALARAWRRALAHPIGPGTFAVLLAWIIAAFFDTPHHSGTMNGLMQFALLLTIPTGAASAFAREPALRGGVSPPAG